MQDEDGRYAGWRQQLEEIDRAAEADPDVAFLIAQAAREPERRAKLERVAREAGMTLPALRPRSA